MNRLEKTYGLRPFVYQTDGFFHVFFIVVFMNFLKYIIYLLFIMFFNYYSTICHQL